MMKNFVLFLGLSVAAFSAYGDDRPARYIEKPLLAEIGEGSELEACLGDMLALFLPDRTLQGIIGPFESIYHGRPDATRVRYTVFFKPRSVYVLDFITDEEGGWKVGADGARSASRMYPAAWVEKSTVRGDSMEGPASFALSLDRCADLIPRGESR
jgi:hypothetical protein